MRRPGGEAMTPPPNANPSPAVDENTRAAVPLFGSWRMAYIVVVAAFVCNVALFYAISRYFA